MNLQVLYVPPPDLEARYEILRVHTRHINVASDVDLRQLAKDTELFNGAELEGLCREAGFLALRENISAKIVCNRHFKTARSSLKPSLSREDVISYSSFKKNPAPITSGTIISNSKQIKNFRGSMAPVTVVFVLSVLFAGFKYIFKHTDVMPTEVATT